MKRVSVSTAIVVLMSTFSLGAQGSPAKEKRGEGERPRSVFFYVIDTCRADRVGFDGYSRMTTPFLQWLSERSVVFENCYSQAPWTKPSMASMLSSQYPSTNGVYLMGHKLPAETLTWPEHLNANGFYTAGFSANIVMGNVLSGFAQGFDHFVESVAVNNGDPIKLASGSAKKLNDHVFDWLDRNDHWPSLLYVHSVDPHEEYEPDPEYLEKFADPDRHLRFRQEWKDLLSSRPPIPGLFVTQDNFDLNEIDAQSFIEHGSNLYDADLLANDDQVKLLWEKLQEEGWGEDFIFVFTSDHGEEFFEHGGTSHGYSLYDEMIRVPLMIYAPGLLPGGERIQDPVRSLDIFPTLCDLLDLEIPDSVQGRSLVPLVLDEDDEGDRAIFSEHRGDPMSRLMGQGSGDFVSVRAGRWKFISNQKGSQLIEKPRYELYDLKNDPDEKVNVADQHPEIAKQLEMRVLTYLGDHRAGVELEEMANDDPEVLAQLRALGYISGDQSVGGPKPKADAMGLWEAMWTQKVDDVRVALKQGGDPNQVNPLLGVRPISLAAIRGDVACLEALIEGGAEVDGRNLDRATALMGAALFGRVEALELLLDEGADPNAKNAAGDKASAATKAPWPITKIVAGLLRIRLDREAIESGRDECAEILAGE